MTPSKSRTKTASSSRAISSGSAAPSRSAADLLLPLQRAIARTEELGILYASDDWSPLSDITLALLLKRAGIRWRYVPLDGLTEIVWPPICGVHVLHLERAQTPGERRLAVRHGLGHVLAGHLNELAFRHDRDDPLGHEETVADLFALMDLIPTRQLAELHGAGYSQPEMVHWVTCELRRYAPRWTEERLADRVRLRLQIP